VAPFGKTGKVGEMLEDMQQGGVIEESLGPWFSPVVLVQKKKREYWLLRGLQKAE
jgi:hypothetical protein